MSLGFGVANVPRIGTVLFDLDGTLIDSRPGIVRCANAALAEHGMPPLRAEQVASFIGPPLRDSFRTLDPDEAILESLVSTYRSYYGAGGVFEFELYDGVASLLEQLAESPISVGLATSKSRTFAELILQRVELDGYFDTIAGAFDDGTRAQKSDVMLRALSGLGSPLPDSVAMVGDRIFDLNGARETGTHFLIAGWGFCEDGEFDHDEDAVFLDHPRDVARWITRRPSLNDIS